MEGGTRQILERLPFPIKELHPDNGPEFLNHHLVRILGETIPGLTLTRSRPYQKHANRFVEQKHDTLVRASLGQARLDTAELCAALNRLDDDLWIFYHLLQPVRHLVEKTHDGTRVRRRWDDAQTPFARVLATNTLAPTARERLERLSDETNPRALRRSIHDGLHTLLTRRPQLLAAPTAATNGPEPARVAS